MPERRQKPRSRFSIALSTAAGRAAAVTKVDDASSVRVARTPADGTEPRRSVENKDDDDDNDEDEDEDDDDEDRSWSAS